MEDPQAIYQRTGERIRFFRKLKKLSQEQLAAAIYKSESTISKYESGLLSMDLATLCDIARALQVEPHQLIGLPPAAPAKAPHAPFPFDNTDRLYGYCLDGHSRICKMMLRLETDRVAGGSIPCCYYNALPSFDEFEKCESFFRGWINCYELFSLAVIQDQRAPTTWMGLAIRHSAPDSRLFQSALYGIWTERLTQYAVKGIFSAEKIPDCKIDSSALLFTAEELKFAKKSGMLFF